MKIINNLRITGAINFQWEKKPRNLCIQFHGGKFSWWYSFLTLDFQWTGITCAHEIWAFEFFIFKFFGLTIEYTKDECSDEEWDEELKEIK